MPFKHYNMKPLQNAVLEISYIWLLDRETQWAELLDVIFFRIIDLGSESYTEKNVPVSVLLTVLAWNNI